MESLVLDEYLGDHVIKIIPLKHKLRLRRVNKDFQLAIEGWIARYKKRFELGFVLQRKLRINFTIDQVVAYVGLLPEQLDEFAIDHELHALVCDRQGRVSEAAWQKLWDAIQERVYAARQIAFYLTYAKEFDLWNSRIDFSKLKCCSIILPRQYDADESRLRSLLQNLTKVPQLHSILFPACFAYAYLRDNSISLVSWLMSSSCEEYQALFPKIKEIENVNIKDLKRASDTFHNLVMLDVDAIPYDLFVEQDVTEESISNRVLSVIDSCKFEKMESLRIVYPPIIDHKLMEMMAFKWPNLK